MTIKPTRFPNGITTANVGDLFANSGVLDPTKYSTLFEDFFYLSADDWTAASTEVGSGSATEVITDEKHGVILITTDDADNDNTFFYKKGESFAFESGKSLFFEAKVKTSDATQTDIIVGLAPTDSTPLDVAQGVYFRVDDGDTNVDFYLEKDNTSTALSAVATMADDTYIRLGFYYNGVDAVEYYVDGVKLGKQTTLTNLPTAELTVHLGIQNGEAAAKTLSADYVMIAQER